MKMALAFRHDVGWNVRYVIARVTGSPVHVAVLFGDTAVIEATFGGVRRGVRHRILSRGRWTIVPVPATEAQAQAAFDFCAACVGREYDWLGVLWAWWGGRQAGGGIRRRYFCSELAAGALMAAGHNLQPSRAASYTPRRLWDTVAPWR